MRNLESSKPLTELLRYSHWTSAMRSELAQAIKDLEKSIEAKYFAGRVMQCPSCLRVHSAQGECDCGFIEGA